jgi:adenylate cyclase
MASITITNTGATIPASPAVSILNNLLQAGVAISHVCGGKALCGTCRCKIVSGIEYMSPKTEKEKTRLKAFGNPDNIRLACQSYTYGDITLTILLQRPPSKNRD